MTTLSMEQRTPRWYFGGVASAMAACVTHPLDLLKVQMQTQKGKASLIQMTGMVLKHNGILGLYNGISASLTRQLTYSLSRFGLYETGKQAFMAKDSKSLPMSISAPLAAVSGVFGGLVGSPADLVNVRMQNDMKLAPEQRRNYKHVIDGLIQVVTKEGVPRLWTGATVNCLRAALMTIGQLSFYDQAKDLLLATSYFHENVVTHITSSFIAGAGATALCQPVDVLKTRLMNAKPGTDRTIVGLFKATLKEGPIAFFKGFVPAFVRIGPHTVLIFVFLEQMTKHFGVVKRPPALTTYSF